MPTRQNLSNPKFTHPTFPPRVRGGAQGPLPPLPRNFSGGSVGSDEVKRNTRKSSILKQTTREKPHQLITKLSFPSSYLFFFEVSNVVE